MGREKTDKTLFSGAEKANMESAAPLAVRMRPGNLDEFLGQQHFIGPGKLLRRMLDADRLSSLIFHGPAGTGKTSLATIIAGHTKAQFHSLKAPSATVSDVRRIISEARNSLAVSGKRTVLFIDEIHRFNRAQQDVLLDDVESAVLILIGATTENPYFSINSPLLSRSTVFRFEPLGKDDVLKLLNSAVKDKQRGLGRYNVEVEPQALEFIASMTDGDARRALNALEVGVLSQAAREKGEKKVTFSLEVAKESIQQKVLGYNSDTHYDLASAMQKSMRGSDPDATVYWLARMIAGGEDVRFIARRIAICAAEDVGDADAMATVLAAAAVQIAEFTGLPEAQIPLAQAAIYVACAPKSNSVASAIWQAVDDVKNKPILEVPNHLRDSHYPAAKKTGIGADYKYPHNYKDGCVEQQYLPDCSKKYYKQKKDD